MIKYRNRFHGHGSLRFVYQNGKTVRGPQFALKYCENSRRSLFRVAIVVSKKTHKSAVKRNRVRRRMYECVRNEAPRISRPYDLVFTVFSDQLIDLPDRDLRTAIKAQLTQAGVIS